MASRLFRMPENLMLNRLTWSLLGLKKKTMTEPSCSNNQTAKLNESQKFTNSNVLVIISFGNFAGTRNNRGFDLKKNDMLDWGGINVNDVVRKEDSDERVTYYFYLKVDNIDSLAWLLVRSYKYPREWAVDTLYVAIYVGGSYQKITETYYDKNKSYLQSDRFTLADNLSQSVELKNSLRDSIGEVNLDCFKDEPINLITNLKNAIYGMIPKS